MSVQGTQNEEDPKGVNCWLQEVDQQDFQPPAKSVSAW